MHPELLSMSLFMFVTSCSPGPNNIVASYSGFNFGLIKTIPHMCGVIFGFTTLVIVVNFGLINVFKNFPIIQEILKYGGTIFLIYLAYKISFSSINLKKTSPKPVTFLNTFFFQFVNPKSIIIALAAIAMFINPQENFIKDSIILTSVFFFMAVGSQAAWCYMGKYLRKFATSDKFIKNFNYTMSFLLIVCVILFYV